MILLSVFRDSSSYLDRYISQVKSLREYHTVHVIAVEGDSSDDTYERLQATDFEVLKAEHGGPVFESRDIALRWRQLAAACNIGLTAAVREVLNEPFIYVESDLIWDARTIRGLLGHLQKVPAVAPMSMILGEALFYDVWGHTRNGEKFRHRPPYFPGLTRELTPIDTAGSCFVCRPDVVKYLEFSAFDCIRGIGRSMRQAGFQLWLDPTLAVHHP